MKKYDVAIIGGGASGMAAAIELGINKPDLELVIIEKNDSLGRKIKATGSGRCNITNTSADGYLEIMSFFSRLGLMTRSYENGLVYPYSESAADVVTLLSDKMCELGAEIICSASVTEVGESVEGYSISYETAAEQGRKKRCMLQADRVILALGGKAGPNYGTTGDGYGIARSLGHSVVAPIPVLTSIECEEWRSGAEIKHEGGSSAIKHEGGSSAIKLAGTRSRCRVSLYEDETECFSSDSLRFSEEGELQLTKFGLSGICVFNMTRHMRYNRAGGESLGRFLVRVDLFPDGDIRQFLEDRRSGLFSGERASSLLCSVLKKNVAEYVLERASVQLGEKANAATKSKSSYQLKDRVIASLSDTEVEAIANAVHSLEFHPSAIRGWKEAQATAGGVCLDEIDMDSCESKLLAGLYITGELMDYDGPCGGFNLSNAWLTGIKAARAIRK